MLDRLAFVFVTACAAAPLCLAQTFQSAPNQIPQGNPFNNSNSENVDFADVDLDGDMDCAFADGGDCCNDQNRLWVNLGFLQGGMIGFFSDVTAAQFPAIQDQSRDVDFADIDNDGDPDLHISNEAFWSSQSSRFWINIGGLQGGAAGFYRDYTATHWIGLGINNGTTACSSVPHTSVLGIGGFIDWTADSVFGDFDSDGDLDLVHSSHGSGFGGNVPQRLFLNDGLGRFTEHNHSCYQATFNVIPGGAPALWAQGLQWDQTLNFTGQFADINNSPLGVELGDLDGDYDLDLFVGSRYQPPPRLFRGMRKELGTLIWRDVTHGQLAGALATGGGSYEQEFGDMDGDADLDLMGTNFVWPNDTIYANNGAGVFSLAWSLPNPLDHGREGDWFDYNNDGNLDLFIGSFSGQDRLYEGNGGGGFVDVTDSELPVDASRTLGQDSCDIDLDGDYDLMVANDDGQANVLLLNVGQVPDLTAASLVRLEQAPDRLATPVATTIHVHAYENASWDVLRYDDLTLQYQVNGGGFTNVAMVFGGGQLFLGTIPGMVVGLIGYRVTSTDEHGNTATTAVKSYLSTSGACSGSPTKYCRPKTSSGYCVPSMDSTGIPSLALPSGFAAFGIGLESGPNGLMFFGTTGALNLAFFGGTLCVMEPLHRLSVVNSGGGAEPCVGRISATLSEMLAHPTGGPLLVVGQQVYVQVWFPDPPDPQTVGLTNGLSFSVCP